MPLPVAATKALQPMDPSDIVDFSFTLSQGDVGTEMLASTESVASYTLALRPEAVAAGLQLQTSAPYGTTLIANVLRFWVSIASAHVADAGWDAGVDLGIEFTITTTNVPPRVRQKTLVITVQSQ
jgi:hypothetical protein